MRIFTQFLKRKHIFSLFSARKPHRSSHSIFDCCTHLIRLIRIFSAESWSLTRHDSRPLHRAHWWVRMGLYIHQAGSTSHTLSRSLSPANTHPLMDRISALAHKPCFSPILSPAFLFSRHFLLISFLVPSVRDSRRVIKIYTETKVALI